MRRFAIAVWISAGVSGCANTFSRDPVSLRVSEEVALSERAAAESLTRSRLATIERSLNDYYQAKGKIPEKLVDLVPTYLAEIPDAVLGIKGHKDSNDIEYYPAGTISGGLINGALLHDRGGWGYAYNGERVIVFVNCTHRAMQGGPWYKAISGLGLGSL